MKKSYFVAAALFAGFLTACEDDDRAKPADTTTTTELTAVINGAQQVAPTNSTATGTFAGTYTSVDKKLVYTVTYQGMTPSIAHIHRGAPGVNDAVEIPFANLTSPITGTVTLTDAQAENLLNGRMYVNMHSTTFPGGEIRGDIKKK